MACREFLLEIVDEFLAKQGGAADADPLKARFEELRRFFKLSELETDALQYAFVRGRTAFSSDPYDCRRSHDRTDRLNFFAMCIDHSVAEVREIRKPTSSRGLRRRSRTILRRASPGTLPPRTAPA